jgi:hypothetical protein
MVTLGNHLRDYQEVFQSSSAVQSEVQSLHTFVTVYLLMKAVLVGVR